jgi:hypothetical protein
MKQEIVLRVVLVEEIDLREICGFRGHLGITKKTKVG